MTICDAFVGRFYTIYWNDKLSRIVGVSFLREELIKTMSWFASYWSIGVVISIGFVTNRAHMISWLFVPWEWPSLQYYCFHCVVQQPKPHVCSKDNYERVLPADPFSSCDTPGISRPPHPEGETCVFRCFRNWLVLHISLEFSLAEGKFARFRLRGTQGGGVDTTAQVWVPAGLRGICFGSSKLRNVASHWCNAFCPARTKQDDGKPTF